MIGIGGLPRVFRLQISELGKRFGSRVIFDRIDAEIRQGQVLVVTGPNGSGKSTFVAVVAGLLRPTRGTVRFFAGDRELSLEERRRSLGLVAPDLVLYPELTARENLELLTCLRGSRPEPGEVEQLLSRVGLQGREDDVLAEYSSGMRQRVKYAFALMSRPGLMLLDEPTANLDAAGAALVEAVIAEQRTRGVLILATNDPAETRYADLLLTLGG
jgi:heme exporter protein A